MKNIFLFAVMLFAGVVCLAWTGAATAEDHVRGELLLTAVAPPNDDDRDGYLDEIARLADAVVVKVYAALSLTQDDPLLLLIRSETLEADEMRARLAGDARVLSATPNEIVRLRKTN